MIFLEVNIRQTSFPFCVATTVNWRYFFVICEKKALLFAMGMRAAFQSNLILLKTQTLNGAPPEKSVGSSIGSRRPPRESRYLGAQTVCKVHHVMRGRIAASIEGENSYTDEYKKFAEMLGTGRSGRFGRGNNAALSKEHTSTESTSNESYAEFSEMLGLESKTPVQQKGTEPKAVSSSQSRKTKIDPRDYQLFDSMLQKSGGTGRKPVKGSKRFMTRPPSLDKKRSERSAILSNDEDLVSLESPTDIQAGQSESSRRQRHMTAEETAQAYAIMMEEFGDSLHETSVEVFADDDDNEGGVEGSGEVELLKPPARPGAWGEREKDAERNRDSEKRGVVKENKPAKLLKPPRRPADTAASEQRKKLVKGFYTETNEIRAEAEPEQFLPEPLLPKPICPPKVNGTSTEGGDEGSEKGEEMTEKQPVAEALSPKPIAATKSGGSVYLKAKGENGATKLKENMVETTYRAEEADMTETLLPKPRSGIEKAKEEEADLQFQKESQEKVGNDMSEAEKDSVLRISKRPLEDGVDSVVRNSLGDNGVRLKDKPVRVEEVRLSGSKGRKFRTSRSRDRQRHEASFEADSTMSSAGVIRRGRRSLRDLKPVMLERAMIVYSKKQDADPSKSEDNEISEITAQGLE